MKKLIAALFALFLSCSAGLVHADTRTNDTTNPNTPTNSQDTQKLHQMPEGNAPADSTTHDKMHSKHKKMNVQKMRQKPDSASENTNKADEGTENER